MDIFEKYPAEEQLRKAVADMSTYDARLLTQVPEGTKTEEGLRRSINVTLGRTGIRSDQIDTLICYTGLARACVVRASLQATWTRGCEAWAACRSTT